MIQPSSPTGRSGKPRPRAGSLCLGWLGTIVDSPSGTLLWTARAAVEIDEEDESGPDPDSRNEWGPDLRPT
jgi:hypothetical protein